MARGRDNSLATAGPRKPADAPAVDFWPKQLEYSASHTAIFLLFLGFVLFFYLQGSYRFEILGSIRFELITASTLLVACLMFQSAPRKRSKFGSSGILGWLIAMLVIAGIMSVLSYAPWDRSKTMLIDRVVKMSMMTLFISSMVTTPTRLKWFFVTYLGAFLKMAQEGVLGYFTGSLVWENQGTPRLHGPTPIYAHPNSFSGTQLGTLPFIGYFLPLTSKKLRLLLIGQAIAAIMIVVTTGSRTGYVALAVWLGSMWLQVKSKFKTAVLAFLASLCVLPFLPVDYINRFETIFTQKDAEGASIDMRKEILRDAWSIFTSHPLGVGVGGFSPVRIATFGRFQDTHNLYLEVACDMGIQGLIVFLGFVTAMLRSSRRTASAIDRQLAQLPTAPEGPGWDPRSIAELESHRTDLQLIKATAKGVFFFLVIRLGLGLFGHDFYEVYWWFAAGLLMALHGMLGTAADRTDFFAAMKSGAPPGPSSAPGLRQHIRS